MAHGDTVIDGDGVEHLCNTASGLNIARDHLALRTVVGALLLLSAAKRSYFLYVYWSFRREHGHAPKLDDLQPAEAPPPTG